MVISTHYKLPNWIELNLSVSDLSFKLIGSDALDLWSCRRLLFVSNNGLPIKNGIQLNRVIKRALVFFVVVAVIKRVCATLQIHVFGYRSLTHILRQVLLWLKPEFKECHLVLPVLLTIELKFESKSLNERQVITAASLFGLKVK